MNRKVKVLLSVLMITLMMVTFSTSVFAANDKVLTKPSDVTIDSSKVSGDVAAVGGQVLGIIKTIGIILSVGVIMVLGIKYMMGSAEEKAEYKKTLLPYVIGAGLVFAASGFGDAIYGFFSNLGTPQEKEGLIRSIFLA